MRLLQLIVYLILLIGLIIGFVQGFDSYKQDALSCANYYDADYSYYNEYFYWKEKVKSDTSAEAGRVCCKYALSDDNMIVEKCQK